MFREPSSNSGVPVSEGSLETNLKLNMVKSLFGSWAAFQKTINSHATNMEQDIDQGVIDVVAVNMLLQTLDQMRQTVALCGMIMDDPVLDPRNLHQRVAHVKSSLGQLGTAGRFEWVDGGLLKAIERGEWVVLENANFCNPTVRYCLQTYEHETASRTGSAVGKIADRVSRK